MLRVPDQDQLLLQETTAKLLSEEAPVEKLRQLRDDPVGFEDDYWRRGAELGWTSLLVSEERGGGSISGQGLVDLSLIAYEFGRHAAPGPLAVSNVVAAALSEAGGSEFDEVIAGILTGESIVSWCLSEPAPTEDFDDVRLNIRAEGTEVVLDGVKRPVESAARANHLLVTGRTGSTLTQVLVPTDSPGLSVTPMETVDLTRRFSVVSFDGVRLPASAVVGEVGGADQQVRTQVHRIVALTVAEAVGAMQTGFDTTVGWAFDRYSFGRPLASYQALKHRFADMMTWQEASRGIADAAVDAVATGSPRSAELVSAASAYVGQFGSELLQDCIQIHGGIGLTFDHDIHLFLRRHTLDRALYGTPSEHRRRLGDLALRQEVAA
jgi:alkylation response protein AidB-like acyl-CoA dehydrogenase